MARKKKMPVQITGDMMITKRMPSKIIKMAADLGLVSMDEFTMIEKMGDAEQIVALREKSSENDRFDEIVQLLIRNGIVTVSP